MVILDPPFRSTTLYFDIVKIIIFDKSKFRVKKKG